MSESTMRALVCRRHGGTEVLQLAQLDPPGPPPDGWITIGVQAAAANFADTLMLGGTYQTRPDFPFGPGLECAGVVTAVGEGCERLRVGDRVMALVDHTGFADLASARETDAALIPDNMGMTEAAAFPVAYLSSHVALRWQAELLAGETLLVLGSAGGVGLTAVEIGAAVGARVIAGASTPERLDLARDHGADDVVNYAAEDLRSRVRELTGGDGVDVVFDPVGGDLFDGALSSLGWGGRFLHIGFVGGVPAVPANRLLVKHRSAMGSSLRYYRFRRQNLLARSWEELTDWYAQGLLQPHVWATYPLEDGAAALNALTERRAVGKVVVTIGKPDQHPAGSNDNPGAHDAVRRDGAEGF